ncbi:MAG: zeta toxin family protein [Candidatus Obscuribacterales bacterium]
MPLIAGPKLTNFEDVNPDLRKEAIGLIADVLAKSKSSNRPRLIHLCGIPGAGKTRYAKQWISQNCDFVCVQFDTVMEQLSGYCRDRSELGLANAFRKWELPARAVGYHLFQSLVENRRNILFDHSATSKSHIELIQNVKNMGYHTEMHYLSCSPDEAIRRVQQREKIIQRHTPEKLIHDRHNALPELLPVYESLVDVFVSVS